VSLEPDDFSVFRAKKQSICAGDGIYQVALLEAVIDFIPYE